MVRGDVRLLSTCRACTRSVLPYIVFPACSVGDEALQFKPTILCLGTIHIHLNPPIMVAPLIIRLVATSTARTTGPGHGSSFSSLPPVVALVRLSTIPVQLTITSPP